MNRNFKSCKKFIDYRFQNKSIKQFKHKGFKVKKKSEEK